MADRDVLLLFLTSNKSDDGNDVEGSFRIARRLITSRCKKGLRVCSDCLGKGVALVLRVGVLVVSECYFKPL
jgi:hypothetical protein